MNKQERRHKANKEIRRRKRKHLRPLVAIEQDTHMISVLPYGDAFVFQRFVEKGAGLPEAFRDKEIAFTRVFVRTNGEVIGVATFSYVDGDDVNTLNIKNLYAKDIDAGRILSVMGYRIGTMCARVLLRGEPYIMDQKPVMKLDITHEALHISDFDNFRLEDVMAEINKVDAANQAAAKLIENQADIRITAGGEIVERKK